MSGKNVSNKTFSITKVILNSRRMLYLSFPDDFSKTHTIYTPLSKEPLCSREYPIPCSLRRASHLFAPDLVPATAFIFSAL
jgi:hypothetical protein